MAVTRLGNYGGPRPLYGSFAGRVASIVLSLPTHTGVSKYGATAGATTDTGAGTLYLVSTQSATAPSTAQIKLGQDENGAAADYASNKTPSLGANTFALTGLGKSNTYYNYWYQENGAVVSNVLEGGAWKTKGGGKGKDKWEPIQAAYEKPKPSAPELPPITYEFDPKPDFVPATIVPPGLTPPTLVPSEPVPSTGGITAASFEEPAPKLSPARVQGIPGQESLDDEEQLLLLLLAA